MNALTLATASLRALRLQSALCLLSVAMGAALLTTVLILAHHVSEGFMRNARGIDLVAGAKGSPLQLVLSSVYHADVPAGNIDMAEYERLRRHPQVAQAIPLALGDSYKGYRVVGTSPDYLTLYGAGIAQGRLFAQDFDVVAGAGTGLSVGDKFAAVHGFSPSGTDVHDAHLYTVRGILAPTGTVLDRLLLTNVESVQKLHAGHHHAHEPGHEDAHEHGNEHEHEHHGHGHEAYPHELTAVLLKVRNPVAIMNMPRELAKWDHVQAASPSYQMARLARNLSAGKKAFLLCGAGFVLLSGLTLFTALASSLTFRRYDLAVLRVLGARPLLLARVLAAEALIISLAGASVGIVAGHLIAWRLAVMGAGQGIVLPGDLLMPQASDGWLLLLLSGMGLAAAMVPMVSAMRTDIAGVLAKGRGA